MQTGHMSGSIADVQGQIVLFHKHHDGRNLAQAPKHLKQHPQICLMLALPSIVIATSLHRGPGTVKISTLVLISSVSVQ